MTVMTSLRDLKPIREDKHQPIFAIGDHEWLGWYWSTASNIPPELHLESGTDSYKIVQHAPGKPFFASHRLKLDDGVEIDFHIQDAQTVEDAAAAITAHSFITREAAGVLWHQTQAERDYETWKAALGPHELGEIAFFRSMEYWSLKRRFRAGEKTFELSCRDYGEKTAIRGFDEAASHCQSLFLDVLMSRGGDLYASGAADGAAAMRAKILAAAAKA